MCLLISYLAQKHLRIHKHVWSQETCWRIQKRVMVPKWPSQSYPLEAHAHIPANTLFAKCPNLMWSYHFKSLKNMEDYA